MWETLNEVRRVRRFGRCLDLMSGRIRAAVGDILGNGTSK